MKVHALRSILNKLHEDGDVFIQLPDNEPPVDLEVAFFPEDGRILLNTELSRPGWVGDATTDGVVVLFPLPPVADAAWDHDHNIITWYSLDSDEPDLIGGGD